jgi:sterol desaturase/sphingolipid hydroxylase (fatty acid hydroxylase superfamily)
MTNPPSLVVLVLAGALAQAAMIVASIAATWGLTRALRRSRLCDRRIQRGSPGHDVVVHELSHTAGAILTGAALSALCAWLFRRGVIVVDHGPTSPLRIVAECVGYFLALDAHQYLVHRLMHTRWLFRHVHAVHHRSKTPSALTAFSFHPVEMAALGAYFPLALSVHCFHVHAVVLFGVIGFFANTVPHCGYELAPAWWYRCRLTRWWLTPYFHDVHHQRTIHNFGACTTIWDRVFGTIQPDFEQRFAELHARGAPPQEDAT